MDGTSEAPRGRLRLTVGAAIVVVLVAIAITVAIGLVRSMGAPVEEVAVHSTPTAAVSELYVHVFGAVNEPGLYRVDDGARVVDVIAAAGGFHADADRSAVNLARVVTDGEQLFVPVVGAAPPSDAPGQAPGDAGDGLVNLNTADEAALDTLPRIGPALAGRIIQWREDNGSFTSVEDLLAVPGIGEKMLESLRDLVRV